MKNVLIGKHIEGQNYVPLLNGVIPIGSVLQSADSINEVGTKEIDLGNFFDYATLEENLISKEFAKELVNLLQAENVPFTYIVILIECCLLLSEELTFDMNREGLENMFSAYTTLYPNPYVRFLEVAFQPHILKKIGNKDIVRFTNSYTEFESMDKNDTYEEFTVNPEDMVTVSKKQSTGITLEEMNNSIMRNKGGSSNENTQGSSESIKGKEQTFSANEEKEGESQVNPVEHPTPQNQVDSSKESDGTNMSENREAGGTALLTALDFGLEEEIIEEYPSLEQVGGETLIPQLPAVEEVELKISEPTEPTSRHTQASKLAELIKSARPTTVNDLDQTEVSVESSSTPVEELFGKASVEEELLEEELVEEGKLEEEQLEEEQLEEEQLEEELVEEPPVEEQPAEEQPVEGLVEEGVVEELVEEGILEEQVEEQPAEELVEEEQVEEEQVEEEQVEEEQVEEEQVSLPEEQGVEHDLDHKSPSPLFQPSAQGITIMHGKSENILDKAKANNMAENLKISTEPTPTVSTLNNGDSKANTVVVESVPTVEPTGEIGTFENPIPVMMPRDMELALAEQSATTQSQSLTVEFKKVVTEQPTPEVEPQDAKLKEIITSAKEQPNYKDMEELIRDLSLRWDTLLQDANRRHKQEIITLKSNHEIDIHRAKMAVEESNHIQIANLEKQVSELLERVGTMQSSLSNDEKFAELSNQLKSLQNKYDIDTQELLEKNRELVTEVNKLSSELGNKNAMTEIEVPREYIPPRTVRQVEAMKQYTKSLSNGDTKGNISVRDFYNITQDDEKIPRHGITGVIIKPTKG